MYQKRQPYFKAAASLLGKEYRIYCVYKYRQQGARGNRLYNSYQKQQLKL